MRRSRLIDALRREHPESWPEAGGPEAFLPRSTTEVSSAVRLAREVGASLVPPGASTSREEALLIDLQRMCAVVGFDDESCIVHVEAGMRVPDVQVLVERRGLTLGLVGPTPESDLGAWLAQGAPGARDHADDPVDHLVTGMEVVLPDGQTMVIRPAPRRAVGPDLVGAFVGGRSRLGIITSVHLVAKTKAPSETLVFRFESPREAAQTRAWIRGRGVRCAGTRLTQAEGVPHLIVHLMGSDTLRAASAAVARSTAIERGGVEAGPESVPAAATRPAVAPLGIVHELAERLDPAHVLG